MKKPRKATKKQLKEIEGAFIAIGKARMELLNKALEMYPGSKLEISSMGAIILGVPC